MANKRRGAQHSCLVSRSLFDPCVLSSLLGYTFVTLSRSLTPLSNFVKWTCGTCWLGVRGPLRRTPFSSPSQCLHQAKVAAYSGVPEMMQFQKDLDDVFAQFPKP